MAKKRQSTREEIEKEAQAELNRSMRGSLGAAPSPYTASARSGPAPASDPTGRPYVPWGQEEEEDGGWDESAERRLSAAEEEEAVTGLAIQQMAERWGGGRAPEDHIMNRLHPSQIEEARDRALRDAVARQSRFAKPTNRVPVPTQTSRGFSGSWTSSSPAAESAEPMVWESSLPSKPVSARGTTSAPKKRAAAKKAPTKRKAAPPKKAPAVKKVAPAKKAPAVKKLAPVKKVAPAKKIAPAKKAPAVKKLAPVKKVAPAKKAPAVKKVAPAKKTPAKKSSAGRTPARKVPGMAKKTAPAKRAPTRRRAGA